MYAIVQPESQGASRFERSVVLLPVVCAIAGLGMQRQTHRSRLPDSRERFMQQRHSHHNLENRRFAVETRREAAGYAEKYDKVKQRCIKGRVNRSNCRAAHSTQAFPTRLGAQVAPLQPGASALQSRFDEVAHRRGLPGAAARGAQIRRIVKLWVLRSRRHEIGYFVS